jgi:predicted RNase H-like nuclease (RuvC/YqgF family)
MSILGGIAHDQDNLRTETEIERLKRQLREAEEEIARLRRELGSNHPDGYQRTIFGG